MKISCLWKSAESFTLRGKTGVPLAPRFPAAGAAEPLQPGVELHGLAGLIEAFARSYRSSSMSLTFRIRS